MTYVEALASLPTNAHWSSSFGNPGDLSCIEYWRTKDGARWNLVKELYEQDWHINRIGDAKPV